jgi:hypothetical protein
MMSGTRGKAKSLRFKVECVVCSDSFDNDYIKRHTRSRHKDYFEQNRLVPTRPFSETPTQRLDSFLVSRLNPATTKSEAYEDDGEPDQKYQRLEETDNDGNVVENQCTEETTVEASLG